jgi:5-methylcytosine-specific restriction endonuclease McrA
MKECTRCHIELPLSSFGKHKSGKYGVKSRCKKCLSNDEKNARQNDPDKYRERNKKWNEDNPDKVYSIRKNWTDANKEYVAEYKRNWADEHYSDIIAKQYYLRRKDRILNNGLYYVRPNEIKKLRSSSCFYCGSFENIEIDHIIPIALGGTHSIGNLTSACRKCNASKGSKTIMKWKRLRGW